MLRSLRESPASPGRVPFRGSLLHQGRCDYSLRLEAHVDLGRLPRDELDRALEGTVSATRDRQAICARDECVPELSDITGTPSRISLGGVDVREVEDPSVQG